MVKIVNAIYENKETSRRTESGGTEWSTMPGRMLAEVGGKSVSPILGFGTHNRKINPSNFEGLPNVGADQYFSVSDDGAIVVLEKCNFRQAREVAQVTMPNECREVNGLTRTIHDTRVVWKQFPE